MVVVILILIFIVVSPFITTLFLSFIRLLVFYNNRNGLIPGGEGNEDLLYSLYVALPTNLLIMRRAYGRGALAVERRCGVESVRIGS